MGRWVDAPIICIIMNSASIRAVIPRQAATPIAALIDVPRSSPVHTRSSAAPAAHPAAPSRTVPHSPTAAIHQPPIAECNINMLLRNLLRLLYNRRHYRMPSAIAAPPALLTFILHVTRSVLPIRHRCRTSMCACLSASSLLIHHRRFTGETSSACAATHCPRQGPLPPPLATPLSSRLLNSAPAHHFCGSLPALSSRNVQIRSASSCGRQKYVSPAILLLFCAPGLAIPHTHPATLLDSPSALKPDFWFTSIPHSADRASAKRRRRPRLCHSLRVSS
ncbi:hypothetical protein C8J57DRAFT_1521646 [Mycena rebaudengoi]|nr:hypothetical protein C8J57DRAFT_1521646 [Mycena rebaudengoi]